MTALRFAHKDKSEPAIGNRNDTVMHSQLHRREHYDHLPAKQEVRSSKSASVAFRPLCRSHEQRSPHSRPACGAPSHRRNASSRLQYSPGWQVTRLVLESINMMRR